MWVLLMQRVILSLLSVLDIYGILMGFKKIARICSTTFIALYLHLVSMKGMVCRLKIKIQLFKNAGLRIRFCSFSFSRHKTWRRYIPGR